MTGKLLKRTFVALVGASVTVLSPSAYAQSDLGAVRDRFDQYLATPEVEAVRLTYLREMRDRRYPDCSTDPVFERIMPSGNDMIGFDTLWTPLDLPTFSPGAVVPSSATWTESYDVNYCGSAMRENAILAVRAQSATPQYGWAPPGGTMADPVLARDLVMQVMLIGMTNMASRAEQACSEAIDPMTAIVDTQVVTEHPRLGALWQEHWFVHYCGVDAVLEMTLTPSPRGGTDYAIREVGGATGRTPRSPSTSDDGYDPRD